MKGVARQEASCWEVASCLEESVCVGLGEAPVSSGAFLTGPYSCTSRNQLSQTTIAALFG